MAERANSATWFVNSVCTADTDDRCCQRRTRAAVPLCRELMDIHERQRSKYDIRRARGQKKLLFRFPFCLCLARGGKGNDGAEGEGGERKPAKFRSKKVGLVLRAHRTCMSNFVVFNFRDVYAKLSRIPNAGRTNERVCASVPRVSVHALDTTMRPPLVAITTFLPRSPK